MVLKALIFDSFYFGRVVVLKGLCDVDLLSINRDAVYYYTTLLTAHIQVCFCLNIF